MLLFASPIGFTIQYLSYNRPIAEGMALKTVIALTFTTSHLIECVALTLQCYCAYSKNDKQ